MWINAVVLILFTHYSCLIFTGILYYSVSAVMFQPEDLKVVLSSHHIQPPAFPRCYHTISSGSFLGQTIAETIISETESFSPVQLTFFKASFYPEILQVIVPELLS